MTKGRETNKQPNDDTDGIAIEGIFGHRTKQPLVQITIPGHQEAVFLNPAGARAIGLYLIEAAEAAATDAFLMRVLNRAGVEEPQQAQILHLFRKHREEEREQRRSHLHFDRQSGLDRLMQAERAATDRFLRQFLGNDIGLEASIVENFIGELQAERDRPRTNTA